MRSPLLAATALSLLVPLSSQAAPGLPNPNAPHAKPRKTPFKPRPLPQKPAPTFNPDVRPTLPQEQPQRVDPSKIYHPPVPVKGDLSCRRGDADCNPCTANVRGQFAKMRRGHAKWKRKPWRFEWGKAYAPDSIRPFEAFDEDTHLANALSLSSAHPQAFIRTNEGPSWYAGTHSQKEADRPGTVFVVHQAANGRKRLVALHKTKTQHPNGLHVLGRYLLFAERPAEARDELRVIDLRRRTTRQNITHALPEAGPATEGVKQFGGGLGAAKLSDGSYLLVSTLPGARYTHNKDGQRVYRYHQFYNLKGDISDPAALDKRFVNEQRFAATSRVPQKYEFSENLSLVTECGSGDIYAVHSSGDGEALDGLEGSGYWRLSKLNRRDGVPQLDPIDVFEMSQTAMDCHMRSAASVGISPKGKLEFLCHQYRKDPDPSAVNPFGGNITGKDHWNFRAGTPKK